MHVFAIHRPCSQYIKHRDACYVGLRKSNIESVIRLERTTDGSSFSFFRCVESSVSIWSHAFRSETFEFCFEPPLLVTDACSYFNVIAKVFKCQILRFICSTHCTLSK